MSNQKIEMIEISEKLIVCVRTNVTRAGTLKALFWVSHPYDHTFRVPEWYAPPLYLRGTEESKQRRLAAAKQALVDRIKSTVGLMEAREALYQLCETRVVPDAWYDTPPIDAPMDYTVMTMDDVKAWTPLVEALPRKHT